MVLPLCVASSSENTVITLPSMQRPTPSAFIHVGCSRSHKTDSNRVNAAEEEEITVVEVMDVIDMLIL